MVNYLMISLYHLVAAIGERVKHEKFLRSIFLLAWAGGPIASRYFAASLRNALCRGVGLLILRRKLGVVPCLN